MRKVLLVCNYFAPDNTIAAVRTTKLAKYMRQQGYEVTVIAEEKNDTITDSILKKDAENIHVIWTKNSKGVLKIIAAYKKVIAPIKDKRYKRLDDRVRVNKKTGKEEFYPFETAHAIIGSLDYLFELLRQFDLFKNIKDKLQDYCDYDCLFTSYGDFFSIFAGIYIHKKKKDLKWIFDIRDSICRYKFTPDYVRWIAKYYERYIWREADCITAVSKGICRNIPKKYWKKVHCVTNGYDVSDRDNIVIDKYDNGKIKFAYTGAMYGGLQSITPLFSCIRELINENKIKKDKVEIHFAGKNTAYEIFLSQAVKYKLSELCIYHGKVQRKEALKLQMESDILLVSAFDYQDNVMGVITGKALEYMSANKPIIAMISGDKDKSELAEIIQNGRLGIAYEEAHHAEDIKLLKEYLQNIFKEYEKKGEIAYEPNRSVLRKYDYRYLSKKMMKIMDAIMS